MTWQISILTAWHNLKVIPSFCELPLCVRDWAPALTCFSATVSFPACKWRLPVGDVCWILSTSSYQVYNSGTLIIQRSLQCSSQLKLAVILHGQRWFRRWSDSRSTPEGHGLILSSIHCTCQSVLEQECRFKLASVCVIARSRRERLMATLLSHSLSSWCWAFPKSPVLNKRVIPDCQFAPWK